MTSSRLKNNSLYPIVLLLFLSLIWGSSFVLIKKGLLAYSPIQVGTLRIVFAWLVLLPTAVKHIKTIFIANWKQLFVLGMIANLGPAVLFALAETNMSSSLAGMLNSLTPIFTIIVGVLFYKTKINIPLIIGLGLGLIGSVLLSLIGSGGEIGGFNIYSLLVIAATLLYGISGNLIKTYVTAIDPLVLVSLTMFAVGPVSLIFLLSTNIIHQTTTHPDAIFSAISIFILGAFGTAFALGLFNNLIKITSAVFASTVTYLIPIVAIIWGIIDNEALFPLHFLGIGIIITGIFLINKFK